MVSAAAACKIHFFLYIYLICRGEIDSFCAKGFEGPICGACSEGFYLSKKAGFSCEGCDSPVRNLIGSFSILLAGIIILIFILM